MARRCASQARRCVAVWDDLPLALSRGTVRTGDEAAPARFVVGELAQLGFTTGSPGQIPRCKIIIASCNTLEIGQGRKKTTKALAGKRYDCSCWRKTTFSTQQQSILTMRWVPCARRAALTMRTMRPSTRHRRALAAVVPSPTTVAADARRRPQPLSPTLNAVAAAAAVVRCSGGGAVARLLFEEDDGT